MLMAPLLHIDRLVKRFGGLTATDGACLDVHPGEIHALIGPNGAGKTTLIHQLSGALAPSEGRIVFDGVDMTNVPMHIRARRGLVRSYQITSIFKQLSVRENLTIAMLARDRKTLGIWKPASHARASLQEAGSLAESIGLGNNLDRRASDLSHGEQRQLEVGLALALRPRLLLLDEPMAGMGPNESERMVSLLLRLRRVTTILLVEHDMDAVFRIADRVSTLVFGKVIASGTPAEIRRHPEVRRAYLGDEETTA
uniref:ABC transporter ATP-binding protein n=1 Tax=Cupriavidus yeoncheonensis TaxID=1462994 RepID=UPI003F497A17